MITLITGQPGDGKSLYTITMVKALAEKDNRQVYYSGIPDLRLPWIELTEPEKWHECPTGSIIVIDEAQRIFRPRGNGAAVPRHVAELETHRHKGHDLFIVTQQPMLVDSNVRRLVGRHFHAKRKFGAPASTVHEWSQVKERPDQNRGESIRHEFIFPKSTYALYKSAEVHTHKLRIPMRMWAMCALPIVFAGLVYGTVQWFKDRVDPVKPGVSETVAAGEVSPRANSGHSVRESRDAPQTTEEFLAELEPRVEGMAQTAPRYDRLTQPKSIPYPAACISAGLRCQCWTQQATPLQVPNRICQQLVSQGMFLEFLEPPKPSAAVSSFAVPEVIHNLPPAEQAGRSSADHVSTPPPHRRPGEERSGDPWEGWRVDVRSAKPFVGPFTGVAGQ